MSGMAPKPTKPTRLVIARYVSGVVVIALAAAATAFAAQAPWLTTVSTLAALAAGKYFMIPTRDVMSLGLQLLTPEQVVDVTAPAFASLPPAAAERMTTQLMASLPPDARERASFLPPAPKTPTAITFVGDGEGDGT